MALEYLSGFANSHHSEAIADTLPEGMNSPQQVAHGLYAEKFSGTAFTAPRAENFRSWFYRIRPSVVHGEFTPLDDGMVRTGPNAEAITTPNQLRWDPFPVPDAPADFVSGLTTLAVNGDARGQHGIGIHLYLANTSMVERFFYNADGELMLVPQSGRVQAHTECGVLLAEPGEILVIPRGMKFRIELPDGPSRGYVLENYGAMLRLPERGPIGSDGLANERDFLYPVAAFEDREGDFELVTKLSGHLFRAQIQHSPLDVVGWHGNLAPYKYDLRRFNTIGSISYDHPDPSIFTVLTSPSSDAGVANVDFAIFPPRWLVMENTFRPPWYHRNIMSEFMGLIYGDYDAKTAGGFEPGGASLHNCMAAHGPDADAFEKASAGSLTPAKIDATMAFMFESRYLIEPTPFAMEAPQLQNNYLECWRGLRKNYKPPAAG
ncbi:MAG: homogentisate 1,2-dioxygenase [Gammaproteobacteria bacterium]|nr:homogentisate 1,2-dioxygenase [Gammaproteobacteria bacterium]